MEHKCPFESPGCGKDDDERYPLRAQNGKDAVKGFCSLVCLGMFLKRWYPVWSRRRKRCETSA